ncbi:hypothetical protein FQN60_000492 [Etheostoma spectabile]|uniref:HMG box domain-containing protein n=1 Tax=Etheostoma spectabile TaxID=54343 RepID=A0A5J5D1N8_9PERO|nr:hypothetical protein FQN60_000492 [Etheostoma spectabile]
MLCVSSRSSQAPVPGPLGVLLPPSRRRRPDHSLHGLASTVAVSPPLLCCGRQSQPVYPALSPCGFRQPYSSNLSSAASYSRFPHSLMLGPSGMHPTGIPHPAIVPPTGKQEHDQYDRGMYVKKLALILSPSLLKFLDPSLPPSSPPPLPPLPATLFLFPSPLRKPHMEAKREKEPKKPVIKKPLNAFMLYMKEMRAKVIAECTLKESAAINQILGRRWHALTREEQAKYYELARKERQLHMQLYPTWSARDNYEAGLSGVAGEKSKADWGKKKRRKREKLQDSNTDPGSPKKCRARFGLNQQTDWCGPCRCVPNPYPPPSIALLWRGITGVFPRDASPKSQQDFTRRGSTAELQESGISVVLQKSFYHHSAVATPSSSPPSRHGTRSVRKKKCIRYLQGGGCPSPTSSDLSAIDSPPSPARHRLYQHQLPPSPGCSPPTSPSTHLPLSPPAHTRSHARLPLQQSAGKRSDLRQPATKHTHTHLDLTGKQTHSSTTAALSAAKAAGLSLKVLTESQ